jgi:hypothetical protein
LRTNIDTINLRNKSGKMTESTRNIDIEVD